MSAQDILNADRDDITLSDPKVCLICNNTGWVNSAPDDCPEWERGAYPETLCDCDIGVLKEWGLSETELHHEMPTLGAIHGSITEPNPSKEFDVKPDGSVRGVI